MLETPTEEKDILAIIENKYSLRKLYEEVYQEYRSCISRSVKGGQILELGAGLGFTKKIIPEVITSDIRKYDHVDQIVDALNLPFDNEKLSAILMHNVFHHIRDVEVFFDEALRCLMPGGRILISDEYPGWLSYPILKWGHHEAFNEKAEEWKFDSKDPLLDANGALAYIVFERDKKKFQAKFPKLLIESIRLHTPLRYWFCGGLRKWSLLPKFLFGLATWIDETLIKVFPKLGSFIFIELKKAEE